MIANLPGIKLRYKKKALEFLEENLRFDMARFYQLNPKIFKDYESIVAEKGIPERELDNSESTKI